MSQPSSGPSESAADVPQPPPITSEAEAVSKRAAALALYNAQQYEKSLEGQYDILQFYTSTFGAVHPKTSLAYVDYALSLLAVVQSRDAGEAALSANCGADPEDDEDLQLCYENLEAARISLEKDVDLDETTKQLREAEIHDAIAHVHIERDDNVAAIESFEFALALRRLSLPETDKLCVATLFSIGNCLLKEENYDLAEERLQQAVRLAEQPASNVHADLLADIRSFLQEAKDLKSSGGLDKIRNEIREHFVDEASQLMDPEQLPGVSEACAAVPVNPLYSAVPMADAGSESRSVSFFPLPTATDGGGAAGAAAAGIHGGVHTVAARKKPRRDAAAESDGSRGVDGAPAKSAPRTETSDGTAAHSLSA